MASHRTVFNHIGLCVADRERSRRFYQDLLGFTFWWDLELPDEGTEKLLQLQRPIGVRATYLVRDAFVLELIDYSKRDVHTGSQRVMDQVGLTHMSLSVSDLGEVLAKVVYHRAFNPAWVADTPYNLVLVQLDEGPRMYSNVVGSPNDDIHVGDRVEAVYEAMNDDVSVVRFRLAT